MGPNSLPTEVDLENDPSSPSSPTLLSHSENTAPPAPARQNHRRTTSGFTADLQDSRSNNIQNQAGLKSTLARNQTRQAQSPSDLGHADELQGERSQPARRNFRAEHADRQKLRTEIYDNSLLALSSRYTDFFQPNFRDRKAYEELHRMVGSKWNEISDIDPYDQDPDFTFDPSSLSLDVELASEVPSISEATLRKMLYSYLKWLHSMVAVINKNHARIQEAGLASDKVTVLVLPEPDIPVVELRTVEMKAVQELAGHVEDCILRLMENPKSPDLGHLGNTSKLLQRCCYKIMQSFVPSVKQLELYVKELETHTATFEGSLVSDTSSKTTLYSILASLIFCRSTLERLDLAVLSYESGHTADLAGAFSLPEDNLIKIFTQQSLAQNPLSGLLPGCMQRLPLKFLAPLLGNRKVWVFCTETPFLEQELYVSTDIETFADLWGPVWKVKNSSGDGRVVRYNVGAGAIVPAPVEGAVHPPLAENQRLCHWQSSLAVVDAENGSSTDACEILSTTSGAAVRRDGLTWFSKHI